MNQIRGKDFIKKVVELQEEEVLTLAASRLEAGDDPLEIIDECQQGMIDVGRRYEIGEYFISSLIAASAIFQGVSDLVDPLIQERLEDKESAVILLGTVHNDIHDLGKNLFGRMAACHGFRVIDLGVNIPPIEFRAAAAEKQPDIVGLSGLLTVAAESMQQTVRLFKNDEDPIIANTPIIIGSSCLRPERYHGIGADYWTDNAMTGINICKRLMKNRSR